MSQLLYYKERMIIIKYYCEKCKNLYDTETEVFDCERKHRQYEMKQKEIKEEKENRIKEIEKSLKDLETLCKNFVKDYGESPLTDKKLGWRYIYYV